jgi:hypothetical protein
VFAWDEGEGGFIDIRALHRIRLIDRMTDEDATYSWVCNDAWRLCLDDALHKFDAAYPHSGRIQVHIPQHDTLDSKYMFPGFGIFWVVYSVSQGYQKSVQQFAGFVSDYCQDPDKGRHGRAT